MSRMVLGCFRCWDTWYIPHGNMGVLGDMDGPDATDGVVPIDFKASDANFGSQESFRDSPQSNIMPLQPVDCSEVSMLVRSSAIAHSRSFRRYACGASNICTSPIGTFALFTAFYSVKPDRILTGLLFCRSISSWLTYNTLSQTRYLCVH